MSAISLVAAIVLGAVFVVAGASKLAAGPAWSVQARALGAPEATIGPIPWIELVIGALLVARLFEPLVTLVAIGLLLAFSALIVLRLREGRRPPCACFGAWSATPIGPWHLVRNGALVVVGVLSLAG